MTETIFRFSSQQNAAQQDFGSRLEAATLGLEDAIDDARAETSRHRGTLDTGQSGNLRQKRVRVTDRW